MPLLSFFFLNLVILTQSYNNNTYVGLLLLKVVFLECLNTSVILSYQTGIPVSEHPFK